MADTKPILVRLDADLHDRVKRAARAEDRSMASFIRRALEVHLLPVPVDAGPRVLKASNGLPPVQKTREARCAHPVGRRVGETCMACGAKVS